MNDEVGVIKRAVRSKKYEPRNTTVNGNYEL